ncbi:hypothetical protein [Xanthomonas arboricola]
MEPIHTPGAIQPYGYLLIADPSNLCVLMRGRAGSLRTSTA